MWLALLYLTFSVATVLGSTATGSHILHEQRDVLPDHWTKHSRLHGHEIIPVRIGLTQSSLDAGHDLLMELSDPKSPRYGKHLSQDEVHDLFAPAEESVEQVRAWLESEGIASTRISQSFNKQWLQFDATAGELEKLLRAEYYLHSHEQTGRSHIACREYHVPRSLQSHIDYITPGIKLLEISGSQSRMKRSLDEKWSLQKRSINDLSAIILGTDPPLTVAQVSKTPLEFCDQVITPACVQVMYQIPHGNSATPGNELGIYSSIDDAYNQEDLDLFFSSVEKRIPNGTHPTVNSINGGISPTPFVNASGPESTLDLEMAYPFLYPQNAIIFQTDDPKWFENGSADQYPGMFNNFLDAIDGSYCNPAEEDLDLPYPNPAPGGYKGEKQCGVYKPTNVISLSWGNAESIFPVRYLRRQCHEWMKLGLQGVSVVSASSDDGVQGQGCDGKDGKVFGSVYTPSCPYITVVGGTYLPRGANPHKGEEVAVDPAVTVGNWSSGSGFSNVFERPSYQYLAVEDYFSRANLTYPYYESYNNDSFAKNGGIYNRVGRAYPDVSTVGWNNFAYIRGMPAVGGGTSASAPIFAAMLTRINEERLKAGLPTVGFVNPVLYAHPEVFRDVTVGKAPGCGTDGFPATEGWDPVTGLGTPIYPKLLEVLMDV
ncbi:S53 family peptidase [Aspergillus mulundensis]|uniref:Peptidase S53 domain-containing protein n=1 Tax=Aspergillus mulundensis TaxID=1810919 RepID=A0A3D8RYC6_9EURO|nr:hypothetical protein DSM5745_05919 [Aspergillus mulundensis]RDW79067.1 hypothetical protein DSM5745_05919 [Aspergillus mulundensis]